MWERMSTNVLSHRCAVSAFALVQGAQVSSLVPVCGHPAPTFQGGAVSYRGMTCTYERSLPLCIYIHTHICISICIRTSIHIYKYRHVFVYMCSKLITKQNSSWQFRNFLMNLCIRYVTCVTHMLHVCHHSIVPPRTHPDWKMVLLVIIWKLEILLVFLCLCW